MNKRIHSSRLTWPLLAPTLALALACVSSREDAGAGAAAGWDRFRGPNGTGLAEGSGYPSRLGTDENVIWKRAFPDGFSSPVLYADRLFITGLEEERLFTYCLNRDTGETLWKREAPRPRRTEFQVINHAAAASPAVDETRVVVFFDEYGMLAYDHDGEERWRLPLGPFDNIYGMGASPVIAGDTVVLACDQSSASFVVGVDKLSGDVRWRAERPSAISGHCTPVLYDAPDGRTQVLLPGSYLLDAYDARTGERIWWVRGLPSEMKSVPVLLGDTLWTHGFASPLNNKGQQIFLPDFETALRERDADEDGRIAPAEVGEPEVERLFAFFDLDADGYLTEYDWDRTRAALEAVNSAMAIRVGGEGDVSETNVLWTAYRDVPQLPSPLIVGEDYFMLADQGGLLSVLDAATGERKEKSRLTDAIDAYYASPVAADGKVYLVSESGIASVLDTRTAAKAGFETVCTAELGENCYATPALADGRIWLRTSGHLYCFGTTAD